MRTCKLLSVLLSLLLPVASAARSQESNAPQYPAGLIITSVKKNSPAEKCGLKPGDMLLSIDGVPVKFVSQIAPLRDRARWDGRTIALLSVIRSDVNLSLKLTLGSDFGFDARPPLPSLAQKLYDEATPIPKQPAAAIAKLEAAAEAAGAAGDDRAAAWIWGRVSDSTPDGSSQKVRALATELVYCEKAGDLLLAASDLFSSGTVRYSRGDRDGAESNFKRSLAIRERLAPDSLDLATSLNSVGIAAYGRGNPDEAETYLKRAIAIRERLAPGSLDVAQSLNNLGVIAKDSGKLDEEDDYFKRYLVLIERLSPDSLDMADALNNLGSVANARGKLDEAEVFVRRSLALQQRLAPNSVNMAARLVNLGIIAEARGKYDEAEELSDRALALLERLAPDSLEITGSLINLGNVAIDRGNLEEAETRFTRALSIIERLEPESLDVSIVLNNLGNVAADRTKLDEAEAYHKRALAIRERLAPDSLDQASTLGNLGDIAQHRGNLDEAEAYFKRELALTERLAPDSLKEAISLNHLGHIAYKRGNIDAAARRFQSAWAIVQRQGRQVAGDSGRQQFGAAKRYYAGQLLVTQLALGNQEAAFVTLEEGRAQALVEVIAERGVTENVTPPSIWRAYQSAETAHNIAYKDAERAAAPVQLAEALLAALKEQKVDEATLTEKQRALDEAQGLFKAKLSEEIRTRGEMENRWTEVRRAAKSALPLPIDSNQARRRLAPNTLLLEFSIDEKDLTLFAATSGSVKAYYLPGVNEELEAKVKFIRRYVARDTDDRGPSLEYNSDIERDALRSLFQKLFPLDVQGAILQAKHIVISPDDFLWDLPFAALITNATGAPTYLGLQKPLSYAQSLTVLVTPTLAGAGPGNGTLVVGNPVYEIGRRRDLIAAANSAHKPAPTTQLTIKPSVGIKLASARRDGELGMMTSDGSAPPQLPFAEQEAKQVAALYHNSAHTGIEPTEAWFRQYAPQAKIIHLATHGFLNAYSAQSSGVLFAVPDKAPPAGQYDNDGALQAWEVWSLKLKADLVVLSACETGRGTKVTGEGLIGLTRAFQYAGAKTIVSSQWKVNDQSTASLMTSFHKHLLAGEERDEALRLAMCDVANSKTPGWSAPYHWAAFVMVGETGKMR